MTRVSERASSISRSDNSVISHTTDSKEDARRVRRTGLGRYLRHSFPALSLHVDCRRWSRVADWSARRKGDSPVGRGRASQSRHTIRPEAAQCPLADRVCPSGLTEFAPGLTKFAPGLTEFAICPSTDSFSPWTDRAWFACWTDGVCPWTDRVCLLD